MSAERDAFIKQHAQEIINAVKGSGLFPSVRMAQMIIESANGKGQPGQGITALKAKNFFGIKADKSWTGPKMAFSTPKDGKPVNYFRVYASVQDSISDSVRFLQKNSRYAANGVFTAKTPEEQAWALQKSGYAEGRDGKGGGYADALIAMINAYHLKELDTQAGMSSDGSNGLMIALGLGIALAALIK